MEPISVAILQANRDSLISYLADLSAERDALVQQLTAVSARIVDTQGDVAALLRDIELTQPADRCCHTF